MGVKVIKLIISDFDGCLLDIKDIHFEALNRALKTIDEKFVITPEEHFEFFDGLSTKKKLEMLAKRKDFPLNKAKEVNELKQLHTCELLRSFENINYNIVDVIKQLKEEGYLFFVASNAIYSTVQLGLQKLGISEFVDKVYSNDDVKKQKPNAEIYLRCMVDAGVNPDETLIIEDSKHGREAAIRSGAHICGIDSSWDFSINRIKTSIDNAKPARIQWFGKDTANILIPMAGAGSRFANAGYQLPKPLIDVNGMPMIQRVIDNLNINANYIFVVQEDHYSRYNLGTILPLIAPGCQIVQTSGLTEGAACTTLLAKEFINNDQHLLIANSDQFVEWDSCDFMYYMAANDLDGGILTFQADNPKWSYAQVGSDGYVVRVAEKEVISTSATVGIYYFKSGADYVKYTEQMISKNIRVNNEFYVCPVYNEYIEDKKRIKIKDCSTMWGLGTPDDLNFFLKNYKGR